MLSSSKILRGLKIEGWKVYQPRIKGLTTSLPVQPASSEQPADEQLIKEIEKEKKEAMQIVREEALHLRKHLLEETLQEAKVLKNKAHEDGYAEGYKIGEIEGRKLQEEGRRFLEEAQREHRQILDGAEKEIIQLAINLSEKFLNCRMEIDPDFILPILSRCIEPLLGDQDFYLRVNPLDEKVCLENRAKIVELLKNESTLEIVADPAVPRGSCRIETESAEVEFLLKKELEILAGKLLELAER